jgi:hypothetical protein
MPCQRTWPRWAIRNDSRRSRRLHRHFTLKDKEIALFLHAFSNTKGMRTSRSNRPAGAKSHRKTGGCSHGRLLTRCLVRGSFASNSFVTHCIYRINH